MLETIWGSPVISHMKIFMCVEAFLVSEAIYCERHVRGQTHSASTMSEIDIVLLREYPVSHHAFDSLSLTREPPEPVHQISGRVFNTEMRCLLSKFQRQTRLCMC